MNHKQKIFSQIYDQFIDKIYRFIFLKVNSQEIAEDLCSETFLKTWQVFKEDEQEIENPQAFLYKIARNLIIDHYRNKAKVQFVSVDCAPINDPGIDLNQESLDRSDMETVRTVLTELRPEYQEIIIWHYVDDLEIPEIAKMLNKSEGAVRVQLHRALKSLKNRIPDRGLPVGKASVI